MGWSSIRAAVKEIGGDRKARTLHVLAHTLHDATTDCVQFLIILVILLVFVHDPTD